MAKNIKQRVPIFVASTYADLEHHRKAVWETLEKLRLGVSGMEVFGARSAEPLRTCVDEVARCRFFIGIIGMRYGSVDEDSGKSFVLAEYETALDKDLDILIYLIDEEKAQIAPKFVDTGEPASKLRGFKDLLRKSHTVESVVSPEDLAGKVERDLLRLLADSGLVIEEQKFQPSVQPEETIQLLRKFDLMPERFRGSEVQLVIRFSGEPEDVPQGVCRALRLEFGSSLSRPITALQPPAASTQFGFLRKLYAEDDGCDFLFEAPDSKEYGVIAKLGFGWQRELVMQDPPFPYVAAWAPRVIKDLETGEVFANYTTRSPVKAVIHVKAIGTVP
jgi:hypothetical protein